MSVVLLISIDNENQSRDERRVKQYSGPPEGGEIRDFDNTILVLYSAPFHGSITSFWISNSFRFASNVLQHLNDFSIPKSFALITRFVSALELSRDS